MLQAAFSAVFAPKVMDSLLSVRKAPAGSFTPLDSVLRSELIFGVLGVCIFKNSPHLGPE